MVERKLITFAVFLLSIIYLASFFYSIPVAINSNKELSSLEENTKVSMVGLPSSPHLSNNYFSFKINDIEVHMNGMEQKINSSLAVTGYKRSFLNRSWIETEKITYDT